MLPHWNGQGLASPKYGNIAIEKLISLMISAGSEKKDLIAKIFGGAQVLQNKVNIFNIGLRNIEYAEESIKSSGIPIAGQSTGGAIGRKIVFNTATGEIRMKYVGAERQPR
jgi:chemotaxis protein CheD